jgi:uncharacterized protein (DUF1501 family)
MRTTQAYQSARGALGLATSSLVQVSDVTGAPYGFHSLLTELASLFTSKQLAVVANVGPLVAPITRAQYQAQQGFIPSNLFSHADQQLEWQTSIAQGNSPTGWSGRAADYIDGAEAQRLVVPGVPVDGGQRPPRHGGHASGRRCRRDESLQLAGFNTSAASDARWNALNNLISTDSGVALVQAANNTLANSISDAKALTAALSKSTPLKTQFPKTTLAAQLQQVAQIIQVQADLGMSRQIFFCSLGGFDTHTAEISTHNQLYPQVSQALAAFYDATEELGVADSVTTFTESDFNRTKCLIMRTVDLIQRKRDGEELTPEEIEFLVDGYTNGDIPDYQMSSFLMAVFFSGMTDREVSRLTECMMRSGETVDLSAIPGVKVDKHSTGGVGDKTSLIVAPLAAAAGVVVPMMSGARAGPHRRHARQAGIDSRLPHRPHARRVSRATAELGLCFIGQTDRDRAGRPQALCAARRHRHGGIDSADRLFDHVEEAGRGRGRAGAGRQGGQRRVHEEAGGCAPPGADHGGHRPPHGQEGAGADHRHEPAAGLRGRQRARSDGSSQTLQNAGPADLTRLSSNWRRA